MKKDIVYSMVATSALTLTGAGAVHAADDTLDVVFINDGHVAPYHVA